jgi:hypothetical protein
VAEPLVVMTVALRAVQSLIGRNAGMDKTERMIRLVRALDTEKQRRIKAEREARTLRTAALRSHLKGEPPAGRKVWHP